MAICHLIVVAATMFTICIVDVAAQEKVVGIGIPFRGKGIDGGRNCGHRIYTQKDFTFGPYSSSCTRYILCEAKSHCGAAKIVSPLACAQAAVKMSDVCEGDYIEARSYTFQNDEVSHCFCNPKGRTWIPDTRHTWSNTYPITLTIPTTTKATTTTPHPILSNFSKLLARFNQLETDFKNEQKLSDEERGGIEENLIQQEFFNENLQAQLDNATDTIANLHTQLNEVKNESQSLKRNLSAATSSLSAAIGQIQNLTTLLKSAVPDGGSNPLAIPAPSNSDEAQISAQGPHLMMSAGKTGTVNINSDHCDNLDLCAVAQRVDAIHKALQNLK